MNVFGIYYTIDEIKSWDQKLYVQDIKEKTVEAGYIYLSSLKGKKGKEIEYSEIKMAGYLLPDQHGLSIKEKQELFSFRNRMSIIHDNFDNMGLPEYCICGDLENISHIYKCEILNGDKNVPPYHYIFNGNSRQQISAYRRMNKSMKTRQQYIDIVKST